MQISKKTFSNGLRFLSVPIAGLQSVSTIVLTGVGSRYESEDKAGISHTFEHMAFKGTTKRPDPLQITREIEEIGGEWNAFTSHDKTGYWIKSSLKHINLVLDILADIIINPLLSPKELEKERKIILEEAKMYRDLPDRHVFDMIYSQVFRGDPLGRNVIGTDQSIRKINSDDLRNFVSEYYHSKNMVVAVAGNIPPELETTIQNHFGPLSPGNVAKHPLVNIAADKASVVIDNRKIEQTHLVLGLESLSSVDQDYFALQVMNNILGQGLSSRIVTEVREKRGLAYSVSSDVDSFHDTGLFMIYAGVNKLKLVDALSCIVNELSKITKHKVSSGELNKSKQSMVGRIELSLENTVGIAQRFGIDELINERVLPTREIISLIERVTEEDILRVATRIFKSEKLSLSVIGEVEGESRLQNLLKL